MEGRREDCLSFCYSVFLAGNCFYHAILACLDIRQVRYGSC